MSDTPTTWITKDGNLIRLVRHTGLFSSIYEYSLYEDNYIRTHKTVPSGAIPLVPATLPNETDAERVHRLLWPDVAAAPREVHRQLREHRLRQIAEWLLAEHDYLRSEAERQWASQVDENEKTIERLRNALPAGWFRSMDPDWATETHGFPAIPVKGQEFTAADGSVWEYELTCAGRWEASKYAPDVRKLMADLDAVRAMSDPISPESLRWLATNLWYVDRNTTIYDPEDHFGSVVHRLNQRAAVMEKQQATEGLEVMRHG